MSRRHRKVPSVAIANAEPGHSSYTSLKSAQALVQRGRAEWVEGGRRIRLTAYAIQQGLDEGLRKRLDEEARERDIVRMRGVFFWNGARNRRGNEQYLPGQVRS